jgi:hypothetical protein
MKSVRQLHTKPIHASSLLPSTADDQGRSVTEHVKHRNAQLHRGRMPHRRITLTPRSQWLRSSADVAHSMMLTPPPLVTTLTLTGTPPLLRAAEGYWAFKCCSHSCCSIGTMRADKFGILWFTTHHSSHSSSRQHNTAPHSMSPCPSAAFLSINQTDDCQQSSACPE